jgi:hypothetical protein
MFIAKCIFCIIWDSIAIVLGFIWEVLQFLFIVFLFFGCGSSFDVNDPAAEKQSAVKAESAVVDPKTTLLRGYIASAFDLSVDGKQYADSEDFYTQELDRLTVEAEASGYEGYVVTFDAEVGLSDLKRSMKVYAIPVEDRGYAGETTVGSDGTFQLTVQKEPVVDYRVRANKRIGVILTAEADTVLWCYNFSAEDQDVTMDSELPIILREFTTRITKYKCAIDNGTGMKIPAKPAAPTIKTKCERTPCPVSGG